MTRFVLANWNPANEASGDAPFLNSDFVVATAPNEQLDERKPKKLPMPISRSPRPPSRFVIRSSLTNACTAPEIVNPRTNAHHVFHVISPKNVAASVRLPTMSIPASTGTILSTVAANRVNPMTRASNELSRGNSARDAEAVRNPRIRTHVFAHRDGFSSDSQKQRREASFSGDIYPLIP